MDPHSSSPQPKRRPRYRGTHPRRFEQRYKELDPASHPGIHEHVRAQGRTPAGTHVPVMLDEVIAALRPEPGEVVVDCTLGYGGHAAAFLTRIAPNGVLIGLDVDQEQLAQTAIRLREFGPRVRFHHTHFAGLAQVLADEGLQTCDVIFADLGLSSMQIDDPSRGFSYKHDGPLDMRMDRRRRKTAADLLQELSVEELSNALQMLSDEPDHHAIAERVVAARERRPISRTKQLVRIVQSAKGGEPSNLGAMRTFQTLRMLVNEERPSLRQLLRIAPYCLKQGGRIGIISFHSGEDRIVAQAFSQGLAAGLYEAISESPSCPPPEERHDNPRSRSAQFRWAHCGNSCDSERPCS